MHTEPSLEYYSIRILSAMRTLSTLFNYAIVSLAVFSFVVIPVNGKGHQGEQTGIADNDTLRCSPCCMGPPGRDGRDGPPGPPATISHFEYIRLKEELIEDTREEINKDITTNKDRECQEIGRTPDKPAFSCRAIFLCGQDNATSGYYWIKGEKDSKIIITQFYCNMEDTRCGIRGGWMRVAHIDMTDPDDTCPPPLRTLSTPKRMCAKSVSTGCSSVAYSTCGIPYTRVCGRAIGYAYRTPDGFNPQPSINGPYIDGLSITHGSPRKHVWSYAAGYSREIGVDTNCPCATIPGKSPPSNVGSQYHCEAGMTGGISGTTFATDPLWDGKGCFTGSNCCSTSGLPWFCRTLSCETTDNIEVRWCCNEVPTNEEVATELLEIYII